MIVGDVLAFEVLRRGYGAAPSWLVVVGGGGEGERAGDGFFSYGSEMSYVTVCLLVVCRPLFFAYRLVP